jgi:hypothetical protein
MFVHILDIAIVELWRLFVVSARVGVSAGILNG